MGHVEKLSSDRLVIIYFTFAVLSGCKESPVAFENGKEVFGRKNIEYSPIYQYA